jgi:hypothetical protein
MLILITIVMTTISLLDCWIECSPAGALSLRLSNPTMLLYLFVSNPTAENPMPSYDLLLKGGTVIDGNRTPRFTSDIAITNGRIAQIVQRVRIGG